MSDSGFLGISSPLRRHDQLQRVEHVVVQRPLGRILSAARHSIDDVVNQRVAKNKVYGFYKVYRQILRASEIHDLEQQWNPLG